MIINIHINTLLQGYFTAYLEGLIHDPRMEELEDMGDFNSTILSFFNDTLRISVEDLTNEND